MRRQSVVHCACRVALVLALVLSFGEIAQAGPIRPLYLSTGSQVQVLVGSSIVDSWTTGDQEFSIAVNTTVKTWSQGAPALSLLGREYELDGTPTGATYLNGVGCCFRDGTTDGQFNYAVRQAAGGNLVYRFDLDWTNPQVMTFFPSGIANIVTGITYDSSDDTFWLSTSGGFFTVLHTSRTGNLISSFSGGAGDNTSIAYDAADDTVWIYSFVAFSSELIHFAALDTTSANFPLSREPGIGSVWGIEFQLAQSPAAVSAPATIALLGLGLAGLGWRRPVTDQ